MKKITLFASLFLICVIAFAQIPNPNFENWTNYPPLCTSCTGSYPTGWTTSDSISMDNNNVHSAVQEGTLKCNGSFSIRLTTWTFIFSPLTFITPALATNGIVKLGTGIEISGGSPTAIRSDSLKGCYFYSPAGSGNIAVISAFLFKRNGALRDTVAVALWNPTTAFSMTNFSIPFIYKSAQTPDSILIVLSSSLGINTSATVGSDLIVDNLSTITVGINELDIIKKVKVYPNPAVGDVLSIDAEFNMNKNISYNFYDGLGKKVMFGELKEKQQINIASLANGIYMLTLNDESGEQLYTTRVTVRH